MPHRAQGRGHPAHGVPGNPNAGPPVTVFVGNITERAQDAMVRLLLNACGPVLSWKRVQGATGKLQAFGFCEYADPDAGLRAIRILHDWEIANDKALVVKVDPKTKGVLDEYKRQRVKEMTGKSPPPKKEGEDGKEDEDENKDDYMDGAMRHEDAMARDRINNVLTDHSKEMSAYVPREERKRMDRRPPHQPPGTVRDDGSIVYTGPKESLDEVDIDD